MTDTDPHMTRRDCCRAGLRLVALAGLLAGGASLLQGRRGAAAAGAPCADASGCPRCPWRRACPAAPRADQAPVSREGRR
jgi:hypothetical protein